jgi:extracellular factor (EF) 3-hydroxypalmitic acid methyl ester biosynthesis protein
LSAGRRGFEEPRPIPQHLLQTEEWHFANRLVEDFKASFFDLSHRLQQDPNGEVPQPLQDQCAQTMDDFNEKLQAAADFIKDSEAADYAWGYAFKEIFPYFMRSRFAERAYYKPSGYAGDHLMMEMIYANVPDGDGKLGRLIDKWCLESGAARAVRGRRKFLKEQLEDLCDGRRDRGSLIRIMNLACGSNRELFDFLADCPYTDQIAVVAIDADPKALEYTHRYVDVFPHRASVKLMNDNVVRWALGRVRHHFGLHDIIYSAGLTDYLDDRIFLSLINRSYECLEKGGTLIIGNFGDRDDNKAFLHYILQWKLIHRSSEDLLAVFSRSRFGRHVKILTEENGVNLFAVATKIG